MSREPPCLLCPVCRRGPGTMLSVSRWCQMGGVLGRPAPPLKYYYITSKRDDSSPGPFLVVSVLTHLQLGGVPTPPTWRCRHLQLGGAGTSKRVGLQPAHGSARLNSIVVNLYFDVYCTTTFLTQCFPQLLHFCSRPRARVSVPPRQRLSLSAN